MKTTAIAAAKGGTAKTSTTAALLQAACKDGRRGIAVDLDPQATLTACLGAEADGGSLQALEGRGAPIQHTAQGIDVLSGGPDLAALRVSAGGAQRLQKALQLLQGDYDICLIDTPPTAGLLVYSALQAADTLLIPLEADSGSLQGLYQICDIAQQVQQTNRGLSITGCIITRYNGRTNINRYMKDLIEQACKDRGIPYLMEIRQGVAVREALALQKSLFDYAPRSGPAADYLKLYHLLYTEGTGSIQNT